MDRRPLAAATMLVALLTLAGCTGSPGSAMDQSGGFSSSDGDVAVEPMPGGAVADSATGGVAAADESGAARSVISTAALSLTVDDPIEAADDAVAFATRAGGRVDSRSETPATDDFGRSANLVVRVPATGLSEFLASVKDLGENEFETITSTDVTAQTRDLDARIAALTTSVARLTTLLASATDTSDLIEIETALSTRQADLESLQAQQRSLADQVALATVSLDFGTEATAPVDEPQDFLSGIVTGFEALVAFLGSIAIAAGVALPWLIVPLIAAVVVIVVLRRRKATARRLGEVSPPPAPDTME